MRLRLTALVLGLALLCACAVMTVRASERNARAELERALHGHATEQAAVLEDYFERARAIGLVLARNRAFTDTYHPSPTIRRVAARATDDALGHLERLYPGRIAEVCFIDRSGRERARVVRGRAARQDELSADEQSNLFFGPTFALRPGEVYQAPAYRSPDTHEWVVSNSTLVPSGPGRRRATVHFEVTLDSFRREAVHGAGGRRVRIVDRRSGQIVIDTAHPERRGAPVDSRLRLRGQRGTVELSGRLAAFKQVPSRRTNANEWYVLVSASASPHAGIWEALGPTGAGLIAAALLLLAFALASMRAYQQDLRRAALHDELTGLPNRTLFRDRLRQAALQCRDGAMAATLVIDLDRFKEVNDTLGHHQGDVLLQRVGERLSECLRAGDSIARFGGDEFAVLLPRVSSRTDAEEVARRIAAAMDAPFLLDGVSLHVTPSIGIALAPVDGVDPDTLVQRADIAMYEAKRASQGHAFYAAERDPYSPRRLAMAAELRAAIEARQLEVHYQPKIELATGAVSGVEALVRWPHPVLGMVSPADFVPLAEQTGLIKPMTSAVLELALDQARQWRDAGMPLAVSVNLSTRSLVDPALPAQLRELLDRFGVAPDLLELEITESMIMSDPARALEVITELSEAGLGLSIDDFGTGYSSLAYLKRLPVRELKIDRGFVMNMASDQADAFIVRCAIDLARNLGLRVVAEGVEDAETVTQLRELGCTTAQGFFFSRPAPASELTSWVLDRAAARAG